MMNLGILLILFALLVVAAIAGTGLLVVALWLFSRGAEKGRGEPS